MKKKKVKTKTAPRRSSPRSSASLSVNRIIIFGTLAAFLVGIFVVFPQRATIRQGVAGISIMHGMFDEATVQLPHLDGVSSFNVYYKRKSDISFTNAVRGIPANSTNYTINYLTKNTDYEYRVGAVGENGAEFYFTPVQSLTNVESM